MFCTFIFAVLVLKYCFSTGDQLQRYCASDISYSNQATYNGYLLPNSMTTRVISPPENDSFRKDLCFTHDVFFLHSRDLRDAWADRLKILHDGQY